MFLMLNLDYIVVGHVLGGRALGIYLVAFNLSSWPATILSSAVRRVSLATFARLAERTTRVGESFVRASGMLVCLALPLAVLLGLYAHPAIQVVYGPAWSAAAVVLPLLGVLATVRVFTELSYDYLVALNRTRPNLWLQVLWAGCLARPWWWARTRTGSSAWPPRTRSWPAGSWCRPTC